MAEAQASLKNLTPEDGKKKGKQKNKSPKPKTAEAVPQQTGVAKDESKKGQGQQKDKGQKSPRGDGKKAPKGQGQVKGEEKDQKAVDGHPSVQSSSQSSSQASKSDTSQKVKETQKPSKPEGQGPQKPSKSEGQGPGAPEGEGQQKTKAQLKAERRAVQEAQRAAKEKQKAGPPAAKKDKGADPRSRVSDNVKADLPDTQKRVAKKLEKQQVPQRTSVQRKIKLFNHLQQYQREVSFTQLNRFTSCGIHPAIIKLGLQYAEGLIVGSNARCVALLAAFKKVISDYNTPPQKELCRDLDSKIKPYISFLTQCRPLSVSMGNAIKYLKWNITHTPRDMSDTKAKQLLNESIDTFIIERITVPAKAISTYACKKIADGDVIMVYACSSLIRHVLEDAYKQGKKFRVIVVDGRPKLEGKEMLRRLIKTGIKCTYVLINAASYVMQEATKVFLGSHALLANGCVMSRVGSSMIALIAKAYNVPTLVCCETYKFCERVQTDSFVFNELGDPNDLVKIGNKESYLTDWKDYNSLTLLNLVYDVTPPELITAVITEFDIIPSTSVPVVLRVKHAETSES